VQQFKRNDEDNAPPTLDAYSFPLVMTNSQNPNPTEQLSD
jgi:hypothetical protein